MPKVYKISRLGQRLIFKIRHHKGHGVHSPFVFNLINNVIEEKKLYYGYSEIQEFLDFKGLNIDLKKTHRLFFRLVNHFKSQTILEIGLPDYATPLALTAPLETSQFICLDEKDRINDAKLVTQGWKRENILYRPLDLLPEIDDLQDCIFLDLNSVKGDCERLDKLFSLVHNNSFIIVTNIRTNRANHALWNYIVEHDKRTAVLDLYKLGIVFFDSSLYRWKYQISF